MITRELPKLTAAINEESWNWLRDNAADLAQAVYDEVKSGATADDIERHVMRKTQRAPLALRCGQAAAHVATNGRTTGAAQ